MSASKRFDAAKDSFSARGFVENSPRDSARGFVENSPRDSARGFVENSPRDSARGFTLLEVLISLSLLAFLSYYTSRSMSSALDAKVKIQSDLDNNALLVNSVGVIKRDIKLAFNYRDISVDLNNEVHKERVAACNKKAKKIKNKNREKRVRALAACKDLEESYSPKVHKKFSQFIGYKDSLYFTTLSFVRSRSSQKVGNQAEVGYYIKPCSSRGGELRHRRCLWRRSSPYVDDDVEKGVGERVLVEGVENLRFRYLAPLENSDTLEWRDNWMSDERGDDQTKDFFPQAVEIILEIKRKKKRAQAAKEQRSPLGLTVIVPISFVNNVAKKDKENKNSKNVSESQKQIGTKK